MQRLQWLRDKTPLDVDQGAVSSARHTPSLILQKTQVLNIPTTYRTCSDLPLTLI